VLRCPMKQIHHCILLMLLMQQVTLPKRIHQNTSHWPHTTVCTRLVLYWRMVRTHLGTSMACSVWPSCERISRAMYVPVRPIPVLKVIQVNNDLTIIQVNTQALTIIQVHTQALTIIQVNTQALAIIQVNTPALNIIQVNNPVQKMV